jgi:acyl-CoA synthetase (AMP-forming)/AMP-acid ligase II
VLPGPPTLLAGILEFPDRDAYDLSTLRLTVTGAAVVPVELIRRLRSEMTFDTIITGYGLTETTGTVSMCRYDDDPETIATSRDHTRPALGCGRAAERGIGEAGRGSPVHRSHRLRARLPILQLRRRARLRRQLRGLRPQRILPLREPRRRPEQVGHPADRAPADPAAGRASPGLMDLAAQRDLAERIAATSGRL